MRFGQYQMPHQLHCGNWEMRTAISSTECSLVAACVGQQNCCHQLNSSVHSHSNVRTAHMGQPCLDPQATVQSKSQHRTPPETNRQHLLTHNNYKMAQLHWDKEKFLAPSNVPLAGWPWHLRQEEGVKDGRDAPQNKKLTRTRKPLSSARPMNPRKEDFTAAFGSSNCLKVN